MKATMRKREQGIEPDERRIFESIYKSLRRFATVVAPADVDADDLVQEALVRVLRKHRLTDLDYPLAYLRRTVLNVVVNEQKRYGVRRAAMTRWAASQGGQAAADRYPSDLAELMRLAPQARAVLYLAEVERFRYDEIAEMLGCSSTAARKKASRARRSLREALATEGS